MWLWIFLIGLAAPALVFSYPKKTVLRFLGLGILWIALGFNCLYLYHYHLI